MGQKPLRTDGGKGLLACHEMQVAMVMGGCKVQPRRGDWEKVSREDAGGGYFLVVYPTMI